MRFAQSADDDDLENPISDASSGPGHFVGLPLPNMVNAEAHHRVSRRGVGLGTSPHEFDYVFGGLTGAGAYTDLENEIKKVCGWRWLWGTGAEVLPDRIHVDCQPTPAKLNRSTGLKPRISVTMAPMAWIA